MAGGPLLLLSAPLLADTPARAGGSPLEEANRLLATLGEAQTSAEREAQERARQALAGASKSGSHNQDLPLSELRAAQALEWARLAAALKRVAGLEARAAAEEHSVAELETTLTKLRTLHEETLAHRDRAAAELSAFENAASRRPDGAGANDVATESK